MLSISPENITETPDGIVMEQLPDGICPPTHIVESLKLPVRLAVKDDDDEELVVVGRIGVAAKS